MFSIEMLPAQYGDCLWIEYGTASKRYRILVDGGTSGTGTLLRKRIAATDGRFELAVVTHIDGDHIDGMLKLLQNPPPGLRFNEFWFNAYRHTAPGWLGAKQGEYLSAELEQLEKQWKCKIWNEAFDRKAVGRPDQGPLLTAQLDGGMKVTVLGPTTKGLSKLRKEWAKVMAEAHLTPGDLKAALARLKKDPRYRPGWLGAKSVQNLADVAFKEDDSPANGSSIVLLLEYGGKRVLLCGDAYPTDIVEGIKRLPAAGQRLRLDACKVPHHGSRANNSKELFRAIDSKRYLVSTNGKRFQHPDAEGIARIVTSRPLSKKVELWFNYASVQNKRWREGVTPKDFKYDAHVADDKPQIEL